MSWTEERVETLKKLWSEGLSASQIATTLGGVSRNAVIGKVHRLKLPGRVKPATSSAKSTSSVSEAPEAPYKRSPQGESTLQSENPIERSF